MSEKIQRQPLLGTEVVGAAAAIERDEVEMLRHFVPGFVLGRSRLNEGYIRVPERRGRSSLSDVALSFASTLLL